MSLLWDTRHKWVKWQTVQILVRCCILQHLIKVYCDCHSLLYGTLGINESTCQSSNLITIIMKSFDIALSSFKWMLIWVTHIWTIVFVEVLRPNQPNRVMSSMDSLPNHTFTGQAYSSKRFTSIVHILSPETDNCPSWISRRERMTIENISLWNHHERMLPTRQGWIRNLLITSQTHIQLSHRGRLHIWTN